MKYQNNKIHHNLIYYLIKLFYIVLLICPFSFSMLFIFKGLKQNNISIFTLIIMSLLIGVIIIYLYNLFKKNIHKYDKIYSINKKKMSFVLLSIVVLIGCTLRWIFIINFNSLPISDFLTAYNYSTMLAENNINILNLSPITFSTYYVNNPSWAFYSISLSYWLQLIGISLLRAKLLNIVVAGLTIISLYFTTKSITGKNRIAIITAFSFSLYPTAIIYSTILSPDHITILLISVLICLISKAFNTKRNVYIWFLLFSGFLIGLIDLYKPISKIFIIAYLIVEIFRLIGQLSNDKYFNKKIFKKFFISVIIVLLSQWGVKSIGYTIVEKYIGDEPKQSVGWFLFVGLANLENGAAGTWSIEHATIRDKFSIQFEGDEKKVQDELFKYTINNVIEKRKLFPSFLLDKIRIQWSNEDSYLTWINSDILNNSKISILLNIYYLYLMVLSLIYIMKSIIIRTIDDKILYIGLIIFGVFLLLSISEVQPRYRYILTSLVTIFSSLGLSSIFEYINDKICLFIRK